MQKQSEIDLNKSEIEHKTKALVTAHISEKQTYEENIHELKQ